MQLNSSTCESNSGSFFISTKKSTTRKSHRNSALKALIHIENNLDEEIRLSDLSRIACVSACHFHRLFSFHMNETLNGYVSRRRMEKAALQLTSSALSITEIGLSNGYGTPASFAKTFKRLTGLNPSSYKKQICGEAAGDALLDRIFLRGLKANQDRFLTDIEPEICCVPDRYALMIRKKGFYSGSFKQTIRSGLQELYQYANEIGVSTTISRPLTSCPGLGFPTGLDDPEAELEVGLTLDKPIIPEDPFQLTVLKGGQYAVYTYYEPARLYKLCWPVYWHWQSLNQVDYLHRKPYQLLSPSDKPEIAHFRKRLHVPIEHGQRFIHPDG